MGVYSTALLAPALIKGAGLKAPRCLLVSVQQTGLRQSYVEDGNIRFSRIGRVNLEDVAGVAAACASESARLQQYLVTMRMLPKANTPIDVMVLAAGQYHAALTEACRSTEVLNFHVVNADTRCRAAGLSNFPCRRALRCLVPARRGHRYPRRSSLRRTSTGIIISCGRSARACTRAGMASARFRPAVRGRATVRRV